MEQPSSSLEMLRLNVSLPKRFRIRGDATMPMKREQLAERLGVADRVVYMYEHGYLSPTDAGSDLMARYADALNVTMPTLLDAIRRTHEHYMKYNSRRSISAPCYGHSYNPVVNNEGGQIVYIDSDWE